MGWLVLLVIDKKALKHPNMNVLLIQHCTVKMLYILFGNWLGLEVQEGEAGESLVSRGEGFLGRRLRLCRPKECSRPPGPLVSTLKSMIERLGGACGWGSGRGSTVHRRLWTRDSVVLLPRRPRPRLWWNFRESADNGYKGKIGWKCV